MFIKIPNGQNPLILLLNFYCIKSLKIVLLRLTPPLTLGKIYAKLERGSRRNTGRGKKESQRLLTKSEENIFWKFKKRLAEI